MPTDPYAEFGGSAQTATATAPPPASDPYSEFGGRMVNDPVSSRPGVPSNLAFKGVTGVDKATGKPVISYDGGKTWNWKPDANVHESFLLGDPNKDAAPISLPQAAKGMVQNVYDISAPNVINQLIKKKTGKDVMGSTNLPIVSQGAPLSEIPREARDTVLPMLVGGIASGDEPLPTPRAQTTPVETPAVSDAGPSLAGKMARHIPVVGRALRAYDLVQDIADALKGKPAPAPAPTPAPNAYGTPPEMMGKMISPAVSETAATASQAMTDAATPKQQPLGNWPAPKGDPYASTYKSNPQMDPVQSTNINRAGFDAARNTMVIEFKSGAVYQATGIPKAVYEKFQTADSQGSFWARNIKGRYPTAYRGNLGQMPKGK